MTKDNILFIIIGLLAGVLVGFFGANYLNRIGSTQAQIPATAPALGPMQQAPPGAGGPTAAVPAVAAALDKARNEPDNVDAQKAAGMMFYRIKNFAQAIPYFEQANRIDPDDYETIVMLGNISFDAQKYVEAEQYYAQALAKKPDDVNVRTDYGLTFFARTPGDNDRAIAEYNKALQYDPKHELTLQNLCVALNEKGDKAALTDAMKRLESINPKNEVLAKLKQQ
jgi:tetratricopeptide (TPR) repeat protein